MDVYMTCLVAIDVGPPQQRNGENGGVPNNDRSHCKLEGSNLFFDQYKERTEREIKLPVLLNMSACSLKLGMWKKTEIFCSFALDIPCARDNPKVYFRRGRALMFIGSYEKARVDLEYALKLLMELDSSSSPSISYSNCIIYNFRKEQMFLRKEMKRLELLSTAAKLSSTRNKNAMELFLGGKISNKTPTLSVHEEATHDVTVKNGITFNTQGPYDLDSPVHAKESVGLYQDRRQQRPYSTLTVDDSYFDYEKLDYGLPKQCFHYYLRIVKKKMRHALYWPGDEKTFNESSQEI